MDSSFLYLVVGFLAGTLASGLLLLWISNQNKKKQDASLEKRNQIIRSVAEIFTDIDSLITSFRTDLLPEDKFRNSLYSKLDAANKIYKPNMHLLDLYFVKFTDMQFARYHQLAHGKLTNLQLDGQTAFDNEIAAIEKSSDLIHSSGPDKNDSQSSAGFFIDKAAVKSSEDYNVTKDVNVMDDEGEDEKIPDFEFVSMGTDQNQVVVEEQPAAIVEEQPAIVDEQPVIVEDEQPVITNDEQPAVADERSVITNDEQPAVVVDEQPVIADDEQPAVVVGEQPVIADDEQPAVVVDEQPVIADDEQPAVVVDEQPVIENDEQPAVVVDEQPEIIDDEQPVIVDEKQAVISNEEPGMMVEELSAVEDSKSTADLDDEIVFEVDPDNVADKKESSPISNTTIEMSKAASSDKSSISLIDESVKEQKSAFQQEFEQVAKEPQDEEMLETIMDLDMGKLLRTGSINIENIDKNTLPPKYAASGRGTDFAQVKEEDSAAEKPKKAVQTAQEIEEQEKIVIARGDDGSLDTILEEASTDVETSNKSGDVNDVAITGDDVANKIDSFFGIK